MISIDGGLPDTHAHKKVGQNSPRKAFKVNFKDNAWALVCGVIIMRPSKSTPIRAHYNAVLFHAVFGYHQSISPTKKRSAL